MLPEQQREFQAQARVLLQAREPALPLREARARAPQDRLRELPELAVLLAPPQCEARTPAQPPQFRLLPNGVHRVSLSIS